MWYKSKRVLLVLFFCFGMFFSGCTDVTQTDSSKGSEVAIQDGKVVMDLADNIKVDATVRNYDIDKVSPLVVDYKLFNNSEITKKYIDNKQITIKETRNEDGNKSTYYEFSDSTMIISDGINFMYTTKFYDYLSELFRVSPKKLSDDYEEYQGELDFTSKEEAISKVTDELNMIGIDHIKIEKVFSLDQNTLNSLNKELNNNSDSYIQEDIKNGRYLLKDTWEKEDECYMMVFNYNLNNIPVDLDGYNAGLIDSFRGNQINVLYSKKGIQMIEVLAIYEKKEEKEKEKIIPLKEALDLLKNKYKNVILTDSITIKEIKLLYFPTKGSGKGELLLIPAWRFVIEATIDNSEKNAENICVSHSVYFDAVTGDEVCELDIMDN